MYIENNLQWLSAGHACLESARTVGSGNIWVVSRPTRRLYVEHIEAGHNTLPTRIHPGTSEPFRLFLRSTVLWTGFLYHFTRHELNESGGLTCVQG